MSRSFVVHSQRERILDAVANLTAQRGYAALTVEGIATEAAVSLQAFYEHFSGKEDAFVVAYEIGHDKALALVRARLRGRSGLALRRARRHRRRCSRFMAGEPAFAHMAMMDVLAATDTDGASAAIKGASRLRADAAARTRARPARTAARRRSRSTRSRGACSSCACTTPCSAACTSCRDGRPEPRTSR